jgi:hypothetical protein
VPAEEQTRLQIGHVLFIDIVGYSKLLVNEQSGLLRELNELVSGTREFREAEAEGKLIRLPTGGATLRRRLGQPVFRSFGSSVYLAFGSGVKTNACPSGSGASR